MNKSNDANVIPDKVRDAFKLLYGGDIVLLGEHDGAEYYLYQFAEDMETGFPQVVKYNHGQIESISGFDAIKTVCLFRPED